MWIRHWARHNKRDTRISSHTWEIGLTLTCDMLEMKLATSTHEAIFFQYRNILMLQGDPLGIDMVQSLLVFEIATEVHTCTNAHMDLTSGDKHWWFCGITEAHTTISTMRIEHQKNPHMSSVQHKVGLPNSRNCQVKKLSVLTIKAIQQSAELTPDTPSSKCVN